MKWNIDSSELWSQRSFFRLYSVRSFSPHVRLDMDCGGVLWPRPFSPQIDSFLDRLTKTVQTLEFLIFFSAY